MFPSTAVKAAACLLILMFPEPQHGTPILTPHIGHDKN